MKCNIVFIVLSIIQEVSKYLYVFEWVQLTVLLNGPLAADISVSMLPSVHTISMSVDDVIRVLLADWTPTKDIIRYNLK